jgi:flagellar motor switch protein FliN/FliY
VQLDEVPEFRVFAGTVKRSDHDAEAANAEIARQLRTTFSALAELLPAETRHTTTSLEEVEFGPETSYISLQVQGLGRLSEVILSLDAPTVAWFEAIVPASRKDRNVHTSMIDTLMDVELPVSILLASREASLSDVLQWGPGAVVEFEAGLSDPVDVVVNKRTIARGSVVLVDGNYGVRVTEVLATGTPVSEA